MKAKSKISILFLLFLMLLSCEEYETVVINTVHQDGSITRQVIMRNNDKNEFNPSKYKVPVDSTWNTAITIEISDENDTTWIMTADKLFMNTDELNKEYLAHNGTNKQLKRSTEFRKQYRWFTTVFRFSEKVEKTMDVNCPVSDFLNPEELNFFYLPISVQKALENGADSVKTKEMINKIEDQTGKWYFTCLTRKGLLTLYDLLSVKPGISVTKEGIMSKETTIVDLAVEDTNEDTLLMIAFGEDFYYANKIEMDSTLSLIDSLFSNSFNTESYDVRINMPGSLISTNGYLDVDKNTDIEKGLLWTVTGEYFLSEDYEMWAESKINNYYAWVISALFGLFVLTGFFIYFRKRG